MRESMFRGMLARGVAACLAATGLAPRPAQAQEPDHQHHFKAGLPPIFRIKGDLRTVRDVPPLSREVVAEFAVSMMNDRLKDVFERTWDVDLAYSTQDGARYRVNVFQQRGNVGMVLRLIPPDVPPFEKLNLP